MPFSDFSRRLIKHLPHSSASTPTSSVAGSGPCCSDSPQAVYCVLHRRQPASLETRGFLLKQFRFEAWLQSPGADLGFLLMLGNTSLCGWTKQRAWHSDLSSPSMLQAIHLAIVPGNPCIGWSVLYTTVLAITYVNWCLLTLCCPLPL